jgi:hypothetical protein
MMVSESTDPRVVEPAPAARWRDEKLIAAAMTSAQAYWMEYGGAGGPAAAWAMARLGRIGRPRQ